MIVSLMGWKEGIIMPSNRKLLLSIMTMMWMSASDDKAEEGNSFAS